MEYLRTTRSEENEIVVEGHKASGHHAMVRAEEDGVRVYDHRAGNGTFVNGKRIEHSERLRAGDVIVVGDMPITFYPLE
jgi:pSer/pThr/pTyr-binding forkhead associated (FHA) protein